MTRFTSFEMYAKELKEKLSQNMNEGKHNQTAKIVLPHTLNLFENTDCFAKLSVGERLQVQATLSVINMGYPDEVTSEYTAMFEKLCIPLKLTAPTPKKCCGETPDPTDNNEEDISAIEHPSHYNQGKIEAQAAIIDWNLSWNLANVVKYISRAGHKGDRNEDLKKALNYLYHEIYGEFYY